jgi:hypothetical protein
LVWSSSTISWIFRPSIPPCAFCNATRALAGGTIPVSSSAAGPVSEVIRPIVIVFEVTPGVEAAAGLIPIPSTPRPPSR